jgi:DNA polymerase-3 subunit delta'
VRLSDVQHQPRAIAILRHALRSGRPHHAYLLDGPEGVGKELAGRALAARLLCEDGRLAPDADACGACRSCRLLATGNHPDFHLIHRELKRFHPEAAVRARQGLVLGIDLVRHFLIVPASNAPTLGRARVFLLREAERMSEDAQNALLKTLEEPPGRSRLILVTSAASRLLPTIRSRCQRIPFNLLPADFITARLRAAGRAEVEARTLAALAQGRVGAALRWAEAGLLTALTEVAELVECLPADDPEGWAKRLIDGAQKLALRLRGGVQPEEPEEAEPEEGEEAGEELSRLRTGSDLETDDLRDALKLSLMLVAAILRDALARRSGAEGLLAVADASAAAEKLATAHSAEELAGRIEACSRAEWMIDRNVTRVLACERLAIAMGGGCAF